MDDLKLTLKDKINVGKNKKILVSDLCEVKGEIFKYIKRGYIFDDEVLIKAGIKKALRDVKTETVFVEHEKEKKSKHLPKETESLKNILKSINVLENIDNYNENYQQEDNEIADEEDIFIDNNLEEE